MKKINGIFLLALTIFLIFIFKNWIFSAQIIGGDWPYFYQETINSFGFLPPAWSSVQSNGFGGPVLVYALDSYLYFTGWLFSNVFHIPWEIVYKIVWFGLFIFLSSFSIYRLLKEQLPNMSFLFKSLGIAIYLTNTYILLVIGGGQMGVALGYAVAPLVLLKFINVIQAVADKKNTVLFSLYAGLIFSLQVMFDIRLAYITLLAVFIYIVVYSLIHIKKFRLQSLLRSFFVVIFIPLSLTAFLHAFWILPFLFTGQTSVDQLGSNYTSAAAVKFFSFAKFENTFGLMHPNWPENIFGKIGFMKAEFLLLPVIAFGSLLFINRKKQKGNTFVPSIILYSSLLALIGIFLAKGANDPFGASYLYLFDTIPGFVMFRDPTKFYTLIAIAYAILIPYSLSTFAEWVMASKRKKLQSRFLPFVPVSLCCMFLIYIFILLRPAFMEQLNGTFTTHSVSEDYIQFKDMLFNDEAFYRTLWIPKVQRFAYTSQSHPAIEASVLLKATTSAELIRALRSKNIDSKLQERSIRYIVIPDDSEKDIFVKDRKYNAKERELYQKELGSYSWIKKVSEFKDLDVYELSNFKGQLWLKDGGALSYKKVSGSQFIINSASDGAQTIIFNETYSPYWKLHVGDNELQSVNYNGVNSFYLPKAPKDISLIYSLDKFFEIGRSISLVALIAVLIVLYIFRKKKSK